MKARDLLVSGLLAGALAAMSTVASAQTTRPPNIVVIMTDDVGWGDLGSYGGGVMRGAPTPNLDRLASEGMRFVNYYGQASCTAGRASFITGRIPIPHRSQPCWHQAIPTASPNRRRRLPNF
jgi:arylsulfatase A-like enzyme